MDTFKVGVYKVVYTATDSSENVTTVERTVAIVDTNGPVIEMFGDNEIELHVGSEYVYAGAKAFDLYDGNVEITVDNQVDASKLGTYKVLCTASVQVVIQHMHPRVNIYIHPCTHA